MDASKPDVWLDCPGCDPWTGQDAGITVHWAKVRCSARAGGPAACSSCTRYTRCGDAPRISSRPHFETAGWPCSVLVTKPDCSGTQTRPTAVDPPTPSSP